METLEDEIVLLLPRFTGRVSIEMLCKQGYHVEGLYPPLCHRMVKRVRKGFVLCYQETDIHGMYECIGFYNPRKMRRTNR